MKYCRFLQKKPLFGLIETSGEEVITKVADADGAIPAPELWRAIDPLSLASVTMLPPVTPSKIICVGRNYREHARELGNEAPSEPLIFFKPPSSILAPGGEIRRPALSQRVDFEGELGVVIGRQCSKLGDDQDAREYILGYTGVNDVTARDLQKKDGQWTRAKGFDTFCPVGPIVVSGLDPWNGVSVQTRVNGELRQQGSTADFIFPLDAIIRYVSRVMTLFPGDLIATGTPEGVGPLSAGDSVEVTVGGVGALRNTVVDDTV